MKKKIPRSEEWKINYLIFYWHYTIKSQLLTYGFCGKSAHGIIIGGGEGSAFM